MRWRYKKRGTEYEEVGRARLQASDLGLLRDGEPVVVYRGDDGELHVRAELEFFDGRFEPADPEPAPRAPAAPAWLISVPIWGAEYVRIFVADALPALRAAVKRLGEPVRLIIHTTSLDEPALRRATSGLDPEFRRVSDRPTYVALQNSHADAVASARPGGRVVLLNADLVVSGNFLERIAGHFAAGKHAVVLLGIRTDREAWRAPLSRPAPGMAPRALLEWGWKHRHRIIRDLEWPRGGSMLPTNLFFAEGASVVARGFHLHPAAIVKQADTEFASTIDGDLLDCFDRDRVHVVTDPDDCAMLEVSPTDRRFPVRDGGAGLNAARVAASMATRASATHRWLFERRIGVVGPTVDCGDEAAAREILELLGRGAPAIVGGRRGRDPHGARGSRPAAPPLVAK